MRTASKTGILVVILGLGLALESGKASDADSRAGRVSGFAGKSLSRLGFTSYTEGKDAQTWGVALRTEFYEVDLKKKDVFETLFVTFTPPGSRKLSPVKWDQEYEPFSGRGNQRDAVLALGTAIQNFPKRYVATPNETRGRLTFPPIRASGVKTTALPPAKKGALEVVPLKAGDSIFDFLKIDLSNTPLSPSVRDDLERLGFTFWIARSEPARAEGRFRFSLRIVESFQNTEEYIAYETANHLFEAAIYPNLAMAHALESASYEQVFRNLEAPPLLNGEVLLFDQASKFSDIQKWQKLQSLGAEFALEEIYLSNQDLKIQVDARPWANRSLLFFAKASPLSGEQSLEFRQKPGTVLLFQGITSAFPDTLKSAVE